MHYYLNFFNFLNFFNSSHGFEKTKGVLANAL